jgi:hypothetical protein
MLKLGWASYILKYQDSLGVSSTLGIQHIGTFGTLKNLRYSILITTQKGESEPMNLPFFMPQSRIFRAYNLTADLNMRYGADIRFISEKLRYLGFSQ